MKQTKVIAIIGFVLLLVPLLAFAQETPEEEDIAVFGLELEKLLALGSGILATALCAFTYMAFKRTGKSKLGLVALAFFLFAVKSFMMAVELFVENYPWVDPLSTLLDFAILLSFFYGVIKK